MKQIYVCIGGSKTGAKSMKSKLFKKSDKIKIIEIKDIKITKNNNYFFIKTLPEKKILAELFKNDNKIIYEPLDFNYKLFNNINKYLKEIPGFKFIHEIICPSNSTKDIFNGIVKKRLSVNYHEYDKRFESSNKITNDIVYIGGLSKSNINENILKTYNITNITAIKNNNLFKKKYDKCIHIDFIKSSHSYFNLHTSTKLATCVKLDCVFICSKVPIYLELLGEEYELYIEEDLSNMNIIIEKAKEILNTPNKYSDYLAFTNKIKEKLSPNEIKKNYQKILFKKKK